MTFEAHTGQRPSNAMLAAAGAAALLIAGAALAKADTARLDADPAKIDNAAVNQISATIADASGPQTKLSGVAATPMAKEKISGSELPAKAESAAQKTLYHAIASDERFTILTTLLRQSDLPGLLQTNEAAHTIFAPTDDAFKKLSKTTLAELQDPKNAERLKALLANHMVEGRLASAQFSQQQDKVKSSAGQLLRIDVSQAKTKGVTIGQARVTQTDLIATNGVIHAIDTVLTPQEKS